MRELREVKSKWQWADIIIHEGVATQDYGGWDGDCTVKSRFSAA